MAVDFTSNYNIKPEDQLFIGSQARAHLETGIDPKEKEIFFKNVKAMYQAICTYIVEKINPSKQPLWQHAEVADIRNKDVSKISSVDFFLDKFPCLLEDGVTRDTVHTEFLDYQAESNLPPEVMQQQRAEEQWHSISKMTDHNGNSKYSNLARIMQRILLIPVSNCACERIFSLVRKKTDFRGTMSTDTLGALMVLKAGSKGPCYETPLSSQLLQTCKSATKQSF